MTSRTTSRMICWRCSTVRFSALAVEPRAEAFERFGEFEVGLSVVQLGVERVSCACNAVSRLRSSGVRAPSSSSVTSCSW